MKQVITQTIQVQYTKKELADILKKHLGAEGEAWVDDIQGNVDGDWRAEEPLEFKGVRLTITKEIV